MVAMARRPLPTRESLLNPARNAKESRMNSPRALRAATLVALLVPVAAACGSAPPADPDGSPSAPSLPLITSRLAVTGELDAAKNKVDWKTMTAALTGDAKLSVTLPEDHKLTGEVGVYNVPSDAKTPPEKVVMKAIEPGDDVYTLTWQAEADTTYLFRIQATSGASTYEVSPLDVKEPPPPDPCANVECGEDEKCEAGQCVAIPPAVCTPACKGGKVCENGECVLPCGGACGKGMICNRTKNECVKDPCAGKVCPAGEKCSGGVCKAPPKPCGGACAADEKCVNNKCEKPAAEAPPAGGGPVTASIQQIVPDGAKTTVIISAGTNKGIKKGDTGSISGVPGVLKVIEVYEYRSKARIDVSADVIGNKKTVVINR
jgi:hypothetical protein